MCFALTLSLNEFETLKDSVRVYISWLSTGLPNSNVNLPTPIRLNSLHYIRKMIGHLENLFVPRYMTYILFNLINIFFSLKLWLKDPLYFIMFFLFFFRKLYSIIRNMVYKI